MSTNSLLPWFEAAAFDREIAVGTALSPMFPPVYLGDAMRLPTACVRAAVAVLTPGTGRAI